MPLRTSIVSLSAAGLLLSGCVDQQEESQEEAPSYDAALEAFYEQDLSWEDCEDEMLCATVRVPADYSDPDGAELGIDIISSETAEGEDPPFLLTNPGGPGASGVDLVIETGDFLFATEVTQQYNILGFDPRGVDRSAPVECLSDDEMDEYREMEQDTQLDEDAAYEQALEQSAELGEKCLQNTGESLGHVDTVSAARDMDIIRAAVGQQTLDYLGFSYGTKLGLAYAEHFPAVPSISKRSGPLSSYP
ncbi:MAG TPA: alpha/beta hydrolase, partial [Candidatus Nesterenkonia stercoripullorum]|nr:alpha/beta hydrolase [Candidatus Nesterenkonia stercoripullorum]